MSLGKLSTATVTMKVEPPCGGIIISDRGRDPLLVVPLFNPQIWIKEGMGIVHVVGGDND